MWAQEHSKANHLRKSPSTCGLILTSLCPLDQQLVSAPRSQHVSSLVYRPNWLFKLSHPNQPTTKQPTNPRGFLCSRQKPREFRIQCPVFLLLLFYFLLSYLLTILVQRPLSLFLNHFLNPGSSFFFFCRFYHKNLQYQHLGISLKSRFSRTSKLLFSKRLCQKFPFLFH